MSYDVALNKAWEDLARLKPDKNLSIKFLADEYTVDLENKKILSLSCNAPIKDFLALLLLHYLTQKLKGLPKVSNEWLTFRELSGLEGYLPAFKKRVIEPIIRKYGHKPEALLEVLDRLPAKKIDQADVGIVLEVFERVPALVLLWRQDEEFSPEANLLFDKSITKIFCTEDIAVLAEFIARQL